MVQGRLRAGVAGAVTRNRPLVLLPLRHLFGSIAENLPLRLEAGN